MTLDHFIDQYDFEGSVILLEGKRTVPEIDQHKLKALGQMLAKKLQLATFRSGNANGADLYFSQGVAAVNSQNWKWSSHLMGIGANQILQVRH